VYVASGLAWDDAAVPVPELVEQRFTIELDGVKISGCPDSLLLHPLGSVLEDYKKTTVYKFKRGVEDWTPQLNIYRYLLAACRGTTADRLRVVAFFRDWSKRTARRSKPEDYPSYQGALIPIETWPLSTTEAFLRERIRLHRAADAATTDAELPLCTPEERWERPTKWAVTVPGRKRALKLYETEAEAAIGAAAVDKAVVEKRPGEPIRCLDYCDVGRSGLCSQWEAQKAQWEGAAVADEPALGIE
jgi:hypothetical protein